MLKRVQKQDVVEEIFVLDEDGAAVRIQCMVRKFIARKYVSARAKRIWQRVFDPKFKIYFWFNRLNGQTQWNLPRFVELFVEQDTIASIQIERLVRGFVGRMWARRKAHLKYTRFYDSNLSRFYWMENDSKKTTWKASAWLVKQDVPMPPEDDMLYKAQQKIKELEAKLKEKESEIVEVRKKRYEELEPVVMKDRVSNAKFLERSKNMDEWTIDELGAWFTELKMEAYIPFIFSNRVDGHLFINLSEDDWADLGIVNKFHIRKLQLILKSLDDIGKAYRIRYERKKEKIATDEDDELMSEYAPSELSDIIAAEDADVEDEEEEFFEEEGDVEEDEGVALSEEQLHEKALDDENIHMQLMVAGDGENYPMIGDIVRVFYTCTLVSTGKVVSSTKNGMQRGSVEFVLGINQVVKGFDRSLPLMSIGERTKITLSPQYAYGKEGLFPHIPPDAEIAFDVTLLGFRPRTVWVKQLIQEPGLSEKPYFVPGAVAVGGPGRAGGGAATADEDAIVPTKSGKK